MPATDHPPQEQARPAHDDPLVALDARLLALYPALRTLAADRRHDTLAAHSKHVHVPAGTIVFDEGHPCAGFPLLLAGEVRVARGSAGGRSLELYRITPGELCVASTACLFGRHHTLPAHAIAAQPTELIVLDPQGFADWTRHEPFQQHVFGIFADRLADLMALVEAVAFQRLDQRLAAALLGHGTVVTGTHQRLADELGTVREIVTRLLRRFERQGWVRIGRERIDLVDPAALRALAAGHEPRV